MLAEQSGLHRAVLTLRYLDGLSVGEVAGVLGRTLHATEALLVRARAAFRRTYEGRTRMTDPFDALRVGDGPVDPDPAFAAALRARVERALLSSRGGTHDQHDRRPAHHHPAAHAHPAPHRDRRAREPSSSASPRSAPPAATNPA